MRIILTGETGGIGSAIKEALKEHHFIVITQAIDWLIFAHGIMDETNVEETFGVNTILPISETEKYISQIKKGVIYISSTAGIRGNDKFPVYSASKAALNSYAQTMARKHPHIGFYALCPGPTDTKFWRSLGLDGKAQSPTEVANAVLRIMDDEFKSGDIITVRNGEVSV